MLKRYFIEKGAGRLTTQPTPLFHVGNLVPDLCQLSTKTHGNRQKYLQQQESCECSPGLYLCIFYRNFNRSEKDLNRSHIPKVAGSSPVPPSKFLIYILFLMSFKRSSIQHLCMMVFLK